MLVTVFFIKNAIVGFSKKITLALLGVVFFVFVGMSVLMRDDVYSGGLFDFIRPGVEDFFYYYFQGFINFDSFFGDPDRFAVRHTITMVPLFNMLGMVGLADGGANLLSEGLDSSKYVAVYFAGETRLGNVYSLFYPYFHDYGYLGALVVSAIVGFGCGVIYEIRKSYYGVLIYSYVMSAVVLSLFSDYFFSRLLSLAYVLFFAWILKERVTTFGVHNR